MPNVQIEERAKEDKGFWRMLAEFLFGFAVADAVRDDKTARRQLAWIQNCFVCLVESLQNAATKSFWDSIGSIG